jgi:hypothetical protein
MILIRSNCQRYHTTIIQYVLGLNSQERKKMILRKNFRGITFLLHLKPAFLLLKSLLQHRGILNIKINENAEKIFCFTDCIQGFSRVIMIPTKLKMKPTLYFRNKLAIEIKISSFFSSNTLYYNIVNSECQKCREFLNR